MGITVVSSLPTPASANAAPTAAGEAAALAGITPGLDFAALLVQQLTGAIPGTPASVAAEARSEPKDEDRAPAEASAGDLLPPGLFIALPAGNETTPAPPSPGPAGVAAGVADTVHGNSRRDSADLAAMPAPSPAAPVAAEAAATSASATTLATDARTAAPPAESAAKFAAPPETPTPTAVTMAPAGHGVAPTPPAPPAQVARTVAPPLGDASWGREFGDSVSWIARNNLQSAQININPPHLGPIQVSLNLSGDQLTASFASPHADVRQAINDAMPQLRDMLAGAGVNLGQANVGGQLQQQAQQPGSQAPGGGRFADDNVILQDAASAGVATPAPVHRGRGLVDLFA